MHISPGAQLRKVNYCATEHTYLHRSHAVALTCQDFIVYLFMFKFPIKALRSSACEYSRKLHFNQLIYQNQVKIPLQFITRSTLRHTHTQDTFSCRIWCCWAHVMNVRCYMHVYDAYLDFSKKKNKAEFINVCCVETFFMPFLPGVYRINF